MKDNIKRGLLVVAVLVVVFVLFFGIRWALSSGTEEAPYPSQFPTPGITDDVVSPDVSEPSESIGLADPNESVEPSASIEPPVDTSTEPSQSPTEEPTEEPTERLSALDIQKIAAQDYGIISEDVVSGLEAGNVVSMPQTTAEVVNGDICLLSLPTDEERQYYGTLDCRSSDGLEFYVFVDCIVKDGKVLRGNYTRAAGD